MKNSQIAVQLWTLRNFLKTPADVVETFRKVRKIGYEAIELAGLPPMDEAEIVRIADGEGLTICAIHADGASIVNEPEKMIDHLNKLNCKYVGYPWPHVIPHTMPEAIAAAKVLNDAAEKYAAAGIGMCYHNHAVEYQKIDGKIMQDLFFDYAPALLAEIDTYWVQVGGCEPLEWVKKMSGRLPLLHVKDYMVRKDFSTGMTWVGGGNLNWDGIIDAAEKGGTKYFIVEEDDCIDICPFESITNSYNFLKGFVK